jgi:hypothetical protein
MTDDTDGGRRGNRTVPSEQPLTADSTEEWSRDDWESLAGDPDVSADLGYEFREWEQFETLDETDQVMFLPTEEEELKDAAFIVAEREVHLDLENHC